MVSKMGFRQHIMLLLFLNIILLTFVGFSSDSFLGDFIKNPSEMSLTTKSVLGLLLITLYIGISKIGVTTGSNFAGVTGILGTALGKLSSGVTKTAVMSTAFAVIVDYFLIYNLITAGLPTGDWATGWFKFIALFILIPLGVDAVFASMDWGRGVQT